LTPFAPAPNTTNAAGLVGQAAAITHTVAASAGSGAQSIVSTGPQLLSAVPTALQGLAQPTQSGFSGILDALGFTSLQSYLSLFGLVTPYTASLATVNMGLIGSRTGFAPAPGYTLAGEAGAGPGTLVSAGPAGLGGSAVSAGTGQANVVGRLSVPPGWAVAAPEVRTVAKASPMIGVTASPAVFTGSSGTLFSEMALAGMAGRAVGATSGLGRQPCAEAGNTRAVRPAPPALGGPITSIAAELQKLAELHDSKVLTDDEFTQLKQRLIAR
jgi:PPE-repeat protein